MAKKEATRVIIYNPKKQTVLAVHPTGRKWKNKEGDGPATGTWNLPGGEVDDGEDTKDCIIREVKEECDYDLKRVNLKYLGFYDYSNDKNLHVYFYPNTDIKITKLKCDSFFESPQGKMLPEINGYKMFNIYSEMHMFFPVLQRLFKKILEDNPQYFE